jgi:protoporphyrinogen oxidase
MMNGTYPLFTPKPGSTASFEGGMQTLIDGLVQGLEALENVSFTMNATSATPEEVAEARKIPLSSVIWCAPLRRSPREFTELNVYAVGYTEAQVASVEMGYGTLIPDETCPVSGILHESDVHGSERAPAGHRLFRIMAPAVRSSSHEEVKASLRHLLSESTPVVFEHIGVRRIPTYPPGYMASLMTEDQAFTRAGWCFSGVSVTHVVAEAERIADRF